MSYSDSMNNEGECLSPVDSSSEGGSYPGSTLMSQEGVYQLTKDLRTFSEALTELKAVFLDEKNHMSQGFRVVAHERLGDLLQVLKMVVDKYTELNSSEILTAAGDLIQHVKGFNYEDGNAEVPPEVFRAINYLAMVFSNSVSECLMGDANISTQVAMVSPPPYDGAAPSASAVDSSENQSSTSEIFPQKPIADQSDELLHQRDSGLETAFERTKILSKYLGELINYVKKKASLEMEHSKNLLKLSQQTKAILSEQSFLPFQSLYCTSLDNDREFASNCQTIYQSMILQQKFVESLQAKKNEHDKTRKAIRDSWVKDKKRLDEAISTMKKAKQTYVTKVHDHQKAKEAAMKAEEEQQTQQSSQTATKLSSSGSTIGSVLYSTGSGKLDKKKKQEEDSNLKAGNAEVTYKHSVVEANKRSKELYRNKAHYLQQLRELMLQCDQTAKSVTISFFQLHHKLYAPLPIQFQAMSEDAKRYEPGFQYAEYIRNLPEKPNLGRQTFDFESCSADGSLYRVPGYSDTESSSSRSYDELSPSTSPANIIRPNNNRRHSTGGSISSEDILEEKGKEDKNPSLVLPPQLTDGMGDSSPVPLRALTKRGFRMAANVREAFKTKKIPKSNLFGVEFAIAVQGSPDGIPLIIKRCVAEIDDRALDTKGIYRVNGVKNRVEKLCSQFDSSPDRVDLSLQSPHDVSGVLKFFLRQLPDPLLQFQFYNTFLEIAKDYQQLITSTNEAAKEAKEKQLPPPVLPEDVMNSHVSRIRETVERLPLENRNTLQYIVSHLTRVAQHSRDNKMTASNLAIVFGPTLLRPITTDGNESLKMLIDLPFQSRLVEMLLVHKDFIFNTHSHLAGNIFPFSGFQPTQPSFPSDDKTSTAAEEPTLSTSASKLSLDSDNTSQINKEGSISLDRDILLSFDEDQVSTSTEHSVTDSQYNTDANKHTALLLFGDGEIVSGSSGLNNSTEQNPAPHYTEDLLPVFTTFDAQAIEQKRPELLRASSSGSLPRDLISYDEGLATPPVPTRRMKKPRGLNGSDTGSFRSRLLHRGSLNLLRVKLPIKSNLTSPRTAETNKSFMFETQMKKSSPLTANPPNPQFADPVDAKEGDSGSLLIDFSDLQDADEVSNC